MAQLSSKPTAHISRKTPHGTIIEGETTVLVDGYPTTRVGDRYVCKRCGAKGVVAQSGAPNVLVANRPVALVGDQLTCGCGGNVVVTGAETVLVGCQQQAQAQSEAAQARPGATAVKKDPYRKGFLPEQADSVIHNRYGQYLPAGTPADLAQRKVQLVPRGQIGDRYKQEAFAKVRKAIQEQTGLSYDDLPEGDRFMIEAMIEDSAAKTAAFYDSDTKTVYLEEGALDATVLHESLHRYAHPNWREMINDMNASVRNTMAEAVVDGQVVEVPMQTMAFDGRALDEGMTELFTAETFPEGVRENSSEEYQVYREEAQKLGDAIGLDTLKRAYFGGETGPVKDAWSAR